MRFQTKSLLAFLTLVLILLNILAFNSPMGKAQTGTSVNGIIYSDTTWTKANSPYRLTGPVAVSVGVTLTIQAGTTVYLGSYYIQVNGTLVAIGDTANAIIFNGGTINFEQSSNSWNEQTQTGCIIDHATLSCSINIYNASPLISNNQLFVGPSGGISVYGGSPVILKNTCDGAISVYDEGLALISNNAIDGAWGGIGCYSQNCDVIDNTFSGCQYAITMGQGSSMGGTIEGNLLYQNNVGIYCGPGQAIIQNNTIANSTLGIQMPYSSSSEIIYNNIQNNQISISLIDSSSNKLDSNNVNATYNWWGTTDTQAINQTIFDFKNNFNLGTVNFVPFLNAPNLQAPILPTSTSTPTTATSAASPTPNLTPSSAPVIKSAVPELSWLAVLLLLLSIFFVAVVFRQRKVRYD